MANRLSLPAQPLSVRQARRFVSDRALALGHGPLRSSAELLTSEVVTNAIVHAGTEITVEVFPAADGIRVEVTDGSPPPLLRPAHPDPEGVGGRGLQLVDMIAAAWGVEGAGAGKIVWFELSQDGGRPNL